MNSVGNLKSTQYRKLLKILQSSLMQNLRIFRAMEGIFFGIYKFELVLENLEKIKPCGPRLSASVSEQRHPDRASVPHCGGRRRFPPMVIAAMLGVAIAIASHAYKCARGQEPLSLFTSSTSMPPSPLLSALCRRLCSPSVRAVAVIRSAADCLTITRLRW
jgi:hypothetical protein